MVVVVGRVGLVLGPGAGSVVGGEIAAGGARVGSMAGPDWALFLGVSCCLRGMSMGDISGISFINQAFGLL